MNATATRCGCEAFAAVTEAAALASGRWLGRGDVEGAERAASTAMREGLDELAIDGRIVVGSEDPDDALSIGTRVGRGGMELDLAVDPLEGRSVVARGDYGAMAMIAVGDAGSFPSLPQMYMRKMAVGPVATGKIETSRPDRGDPRGGSAHQAHPGRGCDRLDHVGDSGHERPPGDRDRRLPAGPSVRRCPPQA